jgi:hypothetical protein
MECPGMYRFFLCGKVTVLREMIDVRACIFFDELTKTAKVLWMG